MDLKELAKLIAADIKIATSVVDELNPKHIISDGHENFLGDITKNIFESLPAILWNIKQHPEVLDLVTEKPKPTHPEPLKFNHHMSFLKPNDEIESLVINISQRGAVKFTQARETEGEILLGCFPPLIAPYKRKPIGTDAEGERTKNAILRLREKYNKPPKNSSEGENNV